MKYKVRKPSLNKSFSSRYKAKYTRASKKMFIPGYGKKGIGIWKNPKKALYNYSYNRTTTSLFDIFKTNKRKNTNKSSVKCNNIGNNNLSAYDHKSDNSDLASNYFLYLEKMSEFKKTNPKPVDIDNYLINVNKAKEYLPYYIKEITKNKTSLPPVIPPRDESIDIYMRINQFDEARNLAKYLKNIGAYKNMTKKYNEDLAKIDSYEKLSKIAIEYIHTNEGLEQSKLRRELSEIDKDTLSWILNRSYFIRKEKINNKNYIYINNNIIKRSND